MKLFLTSEILFDRINGTGISRGFDIMQCTLVLRTVHEGFLGLVEYQQRAVNYMETGLLEVNGNLKN